MSLETPAPATFSEPEPPRAPQWRGAFASLGIGLGAALIGLLPWILTGMRLPLQAMWAFEALPEQMPIALLPLGNSYLTAVVGMLVVGGVVAGIAARALRSRLPARAPLSIAAGLLFVQIVATAQSAQALESGLPSDDRASLYLLASVGIAVVGMLFAVLAFGLVAAAPRAGAMIGLVLGSLAVGWWLEMAMSPRGVLPIELDLGGVVRRIPAVLVGVAIAWAGVRSVGRAIAAVASLLLLWFVPAVATAVTAGVGSSMMLHFPAELREYVLSVFSAYLSMPSLVLPPLVIAVVVAAAGIALRAVLARRRRAAPLSE